MNTGQGTTKSENEILLPPDSYSYTQKEGSGQITSHVGPIAITATGQDRPTRYDPNSRRFNTVSLKESVQQFPRAAEGEYVILDNPAADNEFPKESNASQHKLLQKGRRIVIAGPWTNALWPGQCAKVIEGHKLRSNQYLIAMIYNDKEAEQNWGAAIVEPATEGEDAVSSQQIQRGLPTPPTFAVGSRIVIKGTDVSFYIPPTGVEVLEEEEGKYVRDAATLEQLEYACLVDESGKKEYPRGPQVVFPRPTQNFEMDRQKRRKYKPLELNDINGTHLKVTADFTGPNLESVDGEDRNYVEGEELFVTGKTCRIYYPREELAIIQYGRGHRKHFSTAIPKGEARYVMDRLTGAIELVRGEKMLLPDPRRSIIARRVLPMFDCQLMYPGNEEALAYNRELAQTVLDSPSGRSGLVSEGDFQKQQAERRKVRSRQTAGAGGKKGLVPAPVSATEQLTAGLTLQDHYPAEGTGDEMGATSSMYRQQTYTEPRSVTLNTKFDGVPTIELWPGYAIIIVGASDNQRRVEIGPKRILLEYDEKLGHMNLSTGKPKTTDNLFTTAYLRINNNQVADIVPFESRDHVKGTVKISLRVNFEAETEADRLRWYSVDNYVKYLTDHVRSMLAGATKKLTIAEIKTDYVDIVREAVLGKKGEKTDDSERRTSRPGLFFPNGMRVVECEVLDLSLNDREISEMLDEAQHAVVRSDIELDQQRKELGVIKEKESLSQQALAAKAETERIVQELEKAKIENKLLVTLATLQAEFTRFEKQIETTKASEAIRDVQAEASLARDKQSSNQLLQQQRDEQTLALEDLDAQTKAACQRLEKASGPLCDALVALHHEGLAAELAKAVNVERFFTGEDMSGALNKVMAAMPILQGLAENGQAASKSAIQNRLKRREDQPAS